MEIKAKGYHPGYKAMVKHMLMMGKELHKKMEMCAMNAYVMYWGSDYIPSDADSEGSLKWFSKTERTTAEDTLAAYYVG